MLQAVTHVAWLLSQNVTAAAWWLSQDVDLQVVKAAA
jgi:hypothetical protein